MHKKNKICCRHFFKNPPLKKKKRNALLLRQRSAPAPPDSPDSQTDKDKSITPLARYAPICFEIFLGGRSWQAIFHIGKYGFAVIGSALEITLNSARACRVQATLHRQGVFL